MAPFSANPAWSIDQPSIDDEAPAASCSQYNPEYDARVLRGTIDGFGQGEAVRVVRKFATALYTASTWVVPLIIAITFHEASHGYVARLCGDDTAWHLGRVSFNLVQERHPSRSLADRGCCGAF